MAHDDTRVSRSGSQSGPQAGSGSLDISQMHLGAVLRGRHVNATANRERKRQQRLTRLVVMLAVPLAWYWYRVIIGNPMGFGLPPLIRNSPELAMLGLMLVMITGMMMIP